MIRFQPDTWRDALLRPLAMASPDAWVYVEIVAPDFRFVFAVVLLALLAVYRLRGQRVPAPLPALVLFMVVAWAIWLDWTGNGRYVILLLLLVGPLCIGIVYRLPWPTRYRALAAVLLVAVQGLLVLENDPWRWWGLTPWRQAPAFGVEVPPQLAARPATFVTISSISYSVVAPNFHPESGWINLTTRAGHAEKTPDGLRARRFLDRAQDLQVLFPSLYESGDATPAVADDLLLALNGLLASHRLRIAEVAQCRYLPSSGLSKMGSRVVIAGADGSKPPVKAGFWLCPLARTQGGPAAPELPTRYDRVFEKLEAACPRFFPPGGAATLRIPAGELRFYVNTDTKIYVLDDGSVLYKFIRALNPVQVGRIDDVLAAGFRMDCGGITGRSGLPWERGI